jgi:hypothetical protein
MTPEQAQANYFAGQDAVVSSLCPLDAQVQGSQQQIEALQRKIAQLLKDSSNSSKHHSSEDITQPKKGPKKNHQTHEKGNKKSRVAHSAEAGPAPTSSARVPWTRSGSHPILIKWSITWPTRPYRSTRCSAAYARASALSSKVGLSQDFSTDWTVV